jgi:hypothetical protein
MKCDLLAECRYPEDSVYAGHACSVDQLRVWRLYHGPGAELAYCSPDSRDSQLIGELEGHIH